MPLKPGEMGDGRLHVDLRTGVAGIDKWGGCVREGDPAAIPDSALWYAENVRLAGGKILSRGGQDAVNTVAGTGCIDGFFDAGDMGAAVDEALSDGVTAICGTGYGDFVASRLMFASSAYYDTTNDLKKATGATTGAFAFLDGTRVLVSNGTGIYALRLNSSQRTLVCTLATGFAATSITKFGGTYYIGCAGSNGVDYANSHIAVWDGSATTPSTTEKAETYANSLEYREPVVSCDATDVYVCYGNVAGSTTPTANTAANTFARRNAGAWTAVTFPYADFECRGMTLHGGVLYVYGGTLLGNAASQGTILTYSATTLLNVRTMPTTGTTVNSVRSIDGELYYTWADTTTTVGASLGNYDGAWTDSFKVLNGAVAVVWRFYDDFGGEIYLAASGGSLMRTASRDLSAAYTTASAGTCHSGGTYDQNAAIL